MKPRTIILILLSAIVLIGLISPNGIRAALTNNLWSIKFIKNFFALEGNTSQLEQPPSTHAHGGLFLARQAVKVGDLEQAMGHILPLVETSDRIALDAYADLLYLNEEYQGAIAIWKDLGKTLTLEKAAMDLQGKKLEEPLIIAYQSLYAIDPEKYTSAFVVSLKNQGYHSKSVDLLTKSIQDYPEAANKGSWFRYLGDIYKTQGKWADAENAYKQGLQVDPNDSRSWRNLGLMYASSNLKEYDKAAECFEEYVKIIPHQAYGYLLLGQAYESSGLAKNALIVYQIALKLEPGNEEARKAVERLTSVN